MRVSIVDTGGANLTSVVNAFARLGVEASLTGDWKEIQSADRVILPGVGAARDCMDRLQAKGLTDRLQTLTQPVLGICLGMQVLYSYSEEGETSCLGILPGKVLKMEGTQDFPVPHMGWNNVKIQNRNSENPLFQGIPSGEYFYFVHSFKVEASISDLAYTEHGGYIPAAIRIRNFYGVQFHPERSGLSGSNLLRNFLKI